jgi:type I restriction enzyme S subunit
MALTKKRIGDLVEIVDERNDLGIRDFYGININKEFMPTAARTDNLDESKYKLVTNGRFVFSGMQTGRDECIRISMYTGEKPIIVSPAYTTFEVKATDAILPMYFFMIFMSKEKDRLGWFYSDSSIRSNLDWDRFCEIELSLPPISIQQKYVDVYNSMLANQQSYERGLEDLKIAFDSILDKEKHKAQRIAVGEVLTEIDNRNDEGAVEDVEGINITKQFMPTVANTTNINLNRYKVVQKSQIAYSGMQTGRDRCIRIALQTSDKPIIVSPAYTVFEVKKDQVLPEFIMMWFSRAESDRRGWFMSDSSVRSNLDLDRFYETEIPVPPIDEQRAIVDIYQAYTDRRSISDRLKERIKNMCPILIKGSLEEAEA